MDAENKDTDTIQLILQRIVRIKRSMPEGNMDPLGLHELAICYYELENQRQAAKYLEKLITNYPDYIEIGAVHSLHALCLIQSRQYVVAEKILEERIQSDSLDTRLQAMLAYIYEKTGRNKQAIELLQQILKIKPDNDNALNSLGYLLALYGKSSNDHKLSFACLSKALRSQSHNPAYLDSIGVYYAIMGDKQRARKALAHALRRAPDNSEILEHLREYLS